MSRILAAQAPSDGRRKGTLAAGLLPIAGVMVLLAGLETAAARSGREEAARGENRPRVERPPGTVPHRPLRNRGDGFVSRAGEHDDPRLERGM